MCVRCGKECEWPEGYFGTKKGTFHVKCATKEEIEEACTSSIMMCVVLCGG